MSHKPNFTLVNGSTRCVDKGIPRVLEVKSVTGEVVSWLCLDCDEQVEPYEDRQRVLLVNEDQIESNEIWYDSSAGAWVTTANGAPPRKPMPGEGDAFINTLQEPVFWEPLDDSVRNSA